MFQPHGMPYGISDLGLAVSQYNEADHRQRSQTSPIYSSAQVSGVYHGFQPPRDAGWNHLQGLGQPSMGTGSTASLNTQRQPGSDRNGVNAQKSGVLPALVAAHQATRQAMTTDLNGSERKLRLSTAVKYRIQGAADWWSILLQDDYMSADVAMSQLQEALQYDPSMVLQRGIFGESVLHACLLTIGHWRGLNQQRMAKAAKLAEYLIMQYNPNNKGAADLVNSQYDTCGSKNGPKGQCGKRNCGEFEAGSRSVGEFRGETPLHMALVFNLPRFVKLLIQNGANLGLRAIGNFFVPGKACYFGEMALSFAVSRGRLEFVNIIIEHVRAEVKRGGAWRVEEEVEAVLRLVTQADAIGNTSLHMAVIHKRMDILDTLLKLYPMAAPTDSETIAAEARIFGGAREVSVDKIIEGLRKIRTLRDSVPSIAQLSQPTENRVKASLRRMELSGPKGPVRGPREEETLEQWTKAVGGEGGSVADARAVRCPVLRYLIMLVAGEVRVGLQEWRAWVRGEWWKKELMYVQNCIGLTPLSVAALGGEPLVFDHVLNKLFDVRWIYGPVGCFTLPLEQIDTLDKDDLFSSNAAQDDGLRFHGAMTIIYTEWREALAVNPTIIRLLETKWFRWGRNTCILSFIWTVAYLVILDLLCAWHVKVWRLTFLFVPLDPTKDGDLVHEGEVLDNLQILSLVMAVWSLWHVLIDVVASLREQHKYNTQVLGKCRRRVDKELAQECTALGHKDQGQEYVASTWQFRSNERRQVNAFSERDVFVFTRFTYAKIIAASLQIAHYIHQRVDEAGYGPRSPDPQGAYLLAWAAALAHLNLLQYVGLAWRRMGYLILIIARALKQDVSRFVVVWAILAIGTGIGIHVIEQSREGEGQGFGFRWEELWRVTLGEKPSWSNTNSSEGREWVVLFYIVFTVAASVMLVRVLISMFNETYAAASKNAENVWRIERGRFLLLHERRTVFLLDTCLWICPPLQRMVQNDFWISTHHEQDDDITQERNHEYTMTLELPHNSPHFTEAQGDAMDMSPPTATAVVAGRGTK